METIQVGDKLFINHYEQEIKFNVDGTPDGNYAVRILEAYLKDCENTRCSSAYPPKDQEDDWLCKFMTETTEKRAIELRKAINILNKYRDKDNITSEPIERGNVKVLEHGNVSKKE